MKYIEPEMIIMKSEVEHVITQVSVVPGETVDVPGVDVPEF